MIKYKGGAFGFLILLRLHGSAAFRSLTPGLLSTAIYILMWHTTDLETDPIFDHPYPMAALMVAFTFLLTFKASFSYNRYWEACTHVHFMHSKWLDVGMELSAFHLQSEQYTSIRPPSFGEHPNLKMVMRERERQNEMTPQELEATLDRMQLEPSFRRRFLGVFQRFGKPQNYSQGRLASTAASNNNNNGSSKNINVTRPKSIHRRGISMTQISVPRDINKPNLPPLFLQETAHLLSLLSAVALSTLRNDLEFAESPLTSFQRGMPWPHVDPDAYAADIRKDWAKTTHRSWTVVRFMLGLTRTDADRTQYNAARPFRVVGGVSDAEVKLLQQARGPLAKVAMCSLWLQEFISREHLAGSTGNVASPIISRLYQFTSDGMLGYNQARKVAYIPFPFPHAQITSLFVFVIIVYLPILMLSYLNSPYYGATLNLLTVMCFVGLHEVARELENPFVNVPNDIPLNNFQAQFNEGLVTMFSGWHPDAYWELPEGDYLANCAKKS